MAGIIWHLTPPALPQIGDFYADAKTMSAYVWTGSAWVMIGVNLHPSTNIDLVPTSEELEKHPALKAAWEEYLVIKGLIGQK